MSTPATDYEAARARYGEDAAQQGVLDALEGKGGILPRAKEASRRAARYWTRRDMADQWQGRTLVPLEWAVNRGCEAEQLRRAEARQELERVMPRTGGES